MTIAELVIASDLRHAIERQFRGEGIVIPYPPTDGAFAGKTGKPGNESQKPSHRAIERSLEPDNLQ